MVPFENGRLWKAAGIYENLGAEPFTILFHYDVVRQVVCEGMNDAGSDIDDEDAAGEAFGIAGQGR
ncbi:hypothetical protein BPNPMPFG_006583 (plasmid) [Mesorhizobium sp. AR07]|uniref:hypothetical protein n=1 Tax=unclassified Mesorhizobium TaxID=325217 RepID=UPI00215EEB07|nr:hypothetical protein [Mesorhizobium sp. AR07]UVK48955.1 hypothetical protein BPNPMPFG_006583 [Mesorhizobium sp. AR07]